MLHLLQQYNKNAHYFLTEVTSTTTYVTFQNNQILLKLTSANLVSTRRQNV